MKKKTQKTRSIEEKGIRDLKVRLGIDLVRRAEEDHAQDLDLRINTRSEDKLDID